MTTDVKNNHSEATTVAQKKRGNRISGLDMLIEDFHNNEGTPNFAYGQALNALENIQKSAQNKEQFFEFVSSDIIFTALHTTIMEEMFSAVRTHQDVAIPLIQKFSENAHERDKMVNIHTKNHMRFIAKNGNCEGCSSCEGHKDVAALLPHITKGDADYMIKLYLEVQSIYCALERMIYQRIPTNPAMSELFDTQALTQFRVYISHYVARRLSNT